MNLDILQYIVDSVKFQNDTPEFTKPFTTERGAIIDTIRMASQFGHGHFIFIRVKVSGIETHLRLTTDEADQLARDLMGQLHKLVQVDAKRKAEQRATEQDAD